MKSSEGPTIPVSKILADSKANFDAPPKRGRGRPRKSSPAPHPDLARDGISGSEAHESPGANPQPTVLIPKELLAPALKFPFAYWATRKKNPRLVLEDELANPWAEQLDQVLKLYAPQVTGDQAVLISFLVTSAVIVGSKAMISVAGDREDAARKASDSDFVAQTGPITHPTSAHA